VTGDIDSRPTLKQTAGEHKTLANRQLLFKDLCPFGRKFCPGPKKRVFVINYITENMPEKNPISIPVSWFVLQKHF